MPNKRASNKVRVTVPMEDELLDRVEKYAAANGIDRVAAMKLMCDFYLKQKTNDKNNRPD